MNQTLHVNKTNFHVKAAWVHTRTCFETEANVTRKSPIDSPLKTMILYIKQTKKH